MRLSPVLLAVAALLLPGLAAAADQVPTYDVRPSCRGGSDTQAALESCLRSEADARTQLVAKWSQYPAATRRSCVAETGGEMQSYVELLTCLQIADAVKTLPKENMDLGPARKID